MYYRLLIYLILFLLSCPSCIDPHLGQTSRVNPEVRVWEPFVPSGYRYIPKVGYDSFCGIITNDTITFKFDYGKYGGSVPETNEDIQSIIQHTKKYCEKAHHLLQDIYNCLLYTSPSPRDS